MKMPIFLKTIFKTKQEIKDLDVNLQIRRCADLFVEKHKTDYYQLDYSLESLNIVDKIIKSEKIEQTENCKCSGFEKIASYILKTLKRNIKGDIIWDNNQQESIFIFENFNEFYPSKHVNEQIKNNAKNNTLKLIKKLNEKK